MAIFDFFRTKQQPQTLNSRDISKMRNALTRQLYRFIGGAPLNPDQNLTENVRTYANTAMIYSVTSRLATKSAEIGFKLERKTANGWEDVDSNHEIYQLLDNPNPLMGRQEFFEVMYTFLKITGNMFAYAPKLTSGKTIELWPAPSNLIDIIPGNDWQDLVKGYTITYSGAEQPIPTTDMLHVKYANIDYDNGRDFWGMSPLKPLARTVDKLNSSEDVMRDGYKNRGAFGAIFPEGATDEAVDPDIIDQKQADLDDRINNPDNVKKIIALASKTGFLNFAMSAVDLEVIEDRKLTLRDVCRAYHTPAILYGDSEGSTYNNMAEARKDEMVSAILPDVRRFTDAFTRWYVRPLYGDSYRLVPLTDDIEELQPDKAAEVDKLMKAVFIPVAEKQRMYGIEPDDALKDVYVSPQGMPVDLKDNIADMLRQEMRNDNQGDDE